MKAIWDWLDHLYDSVNQSKLKRMAVFSPLEVLDFNPLADFWIWVEVIISRSYKHTNAKMTKFIIKSVLENTSFPIQMIDYIFEKFIVYLDEAFLYKDFNLYSQYTKIGKLITPFYVKLLS